MDEEEHSRIPNVYLDLQSVNSFVKNIRYNNKALKESSEITYDYLYLNNIKSIRMLDIGIGDGAFTVPILNCFEGKKNLNYFLDCFDVSSHMLGMLEDNLSQYPVIKEKVNFRRKDAEEGLLNTYNGDSFDIIIITFVLHYIKDWEKLLEEVYQCLRTSGLFIQAEIIGDLRNMDGKFDTDSPENFEYFWKKYFYFREQYSKWEPSISVSDLSMVFKYIQRKKFLQFYNEDKFMWEISLTWNDLIDWIINAPVSSLGSGLDPLKRDLIAIEMRKWLSVNNICINDKILLKWGLKVIWMKKK